MVKEIKAYCSSCHGCQLRKVIRSVDKIPITPVSRPELPFQVVNVDLNGPVDPASSQGHKNILSEGNLRLLHVNKIREYRTRVQTVGVIYDIDDEFGEIYETPTVPAAEKNSEALDKVTLDYLSKNQQTQLKDL
ncbi:retrovirus-related Pol polyprotein from transposon 17.6 [Trichonephila clavipes]|uniref:Retrovirus-related Pol polyprotein from transposon 17.6 n=1 Tax=Trichonephila clavipes TaxID=2585209 RepID=A0A8X6SED8_TRICX|nr:retrovirus-related Pol polyprotein from transposon 17.6 [Trichonephila clavipes]